MDAICTSRAKTARSFSKAVTPLLDHYVRDVR
jgi:hypothetical protein